MRAFRADTRLPQNVWLRRPEDRGPGKLLITIFNDRRIPMPASKSERKSFCLAWHVPLPLAAAHLHLFYESQF